MPPKKGAKYPPRKASNQRPIHKEHTWIATDGQRFIKFQASSEERAHIVALEIRYWPHPENVKVRETERIQ